MLESLSNRLAGTLKKLRGQARLSEDNMQQTLREVRIALLEADVGLPVIKSFLSDIQARYIGEQVASSLTPAQQLIKIIQQELQRLLGEELQPMHLNQTPPAVILLAGLQGVGKTTTCGKLANKLKQQKRKVLLASADVYRAAAIDQLKILAANVGVDFFLSDRQQPRQIVVDAQLHAKKYLYDVLIIDTAGRLGIDEAMMAEIQDIQRLVKPAETLFVADSQQGQDAVNVAKAFSEVLDITGLVLTKVDGDSRGGAILSVRQITGKPIKLISVGEKMHDLQDFHPDRIASRILGMGDMLSLIEDIQNQSGDKQVAKVSQKIQKGGTLDFNDMLAQLQQMDKLGGMQAMMDKLPGMGKLANLAKRPNVDEKMITHQKAMILSMTPQERRDPNLIKGSRRRRIAQGSGVHVQEVNRLLKQLKEMKTMMKRMKNKSFMKQLQGMAGQR